MVKRKSADLTSPIFRKKKTTTSVVVAKKKSINRFRVQECSSVSIRPISKKKSKKNPASETNGNERSGKNEKLKWKPVPIECGDDGWTEGDFAGFVGLEELDIDDDQNVPAPQVIRNDKSKKAENDENEKRCLDENETIDHSKRKKKVKKVKNATKLRDPSLLITTDDDDDGEDEREELEFEEYLNDNSVADSADMSEWIKLSISADNVIIDNLRRCSMFDPTPIQRATIREAIVDRKNIYGAAATGSGKTLAFAIPIVNGIIQRQQKQEQNRGKSVQCAQISALILTPTRELAAQIKKHIESIALGSSIRIALVVGGLAIQKQERILSGDSPPDIVVATPGRLWQIISAGTVASLSRSSLARMQYLVIDEADRMIERAHFEELKHLLNLLQTSDSNQNEKACDDGEDDRQIFIFSATLTMNRKARSTKTDSDESKSNETNLIQLLRLHDPRSTSRPLHTVDLTDRGSKSCSAALTEKIIHCMKDDKDLYLYYFLLAENARRSIVFCNSIDCIRRLVNILKFLQLSPLAVHSSMPQKRRLLAIERFTASTDCAILIATDVAARGLDIPHVDNVIHYQCPRTADIYIHRSGRTARVDRAGNSLILCDPQEEAFFLKDFCRILRKQPSALQSYSTNSVALKKLKERIRLAQTCDQFEHQLRKERTSESWFKEAAKAAEIFDSDDEDNRGRNRNDYGGEQTSAAASERAKANRKLKTYQAQLNSLLRHKISFALRIK